MSTASCTVPTSTYEALPATRSHRSAHGLTAPIWTADLDRRSGGGRGDRRRDREGPEKQKAAGWPPFCIQPPTERGKLERAMRFELTTPTLDRKSTRLNSSH